MVALRDLQAPALRALGLLRSLCVSSREQDNMAAIDTHWPQTDEQLHPQCAHFEAAWWTGLQEDRYKHAHEHRMKYTVLMTYIEFKAIYIYFHQSRETAATLQDMEGLLKLNKLTNDHVTKPLSILRCIWQRENHHRIIHLVWPFTLSALIMFISSNSRERLYGRRVGFVPSWLYRCRGLQSWLPLLQSAQWNTATHSCKS